MDDELRKTMFRIRDITYKFMSWELLDIDTSELRTIEEFDEAQ